MALHRGIILSLHLLAALLTLVPRTLGDLERQSSGANSVDCITPSKQTGTEDSGASETVLQISACISIDPNNPTQVPRKLSKPEKVVFAVSTSHWDSSICVGTIDFVTSFNQRFSFELGVSQESDGIVQLDVCRGPGISNCELVQIVLPEHRGKEHSPTVLATLAARNQSLTVFEAHVDLCRASKKRIADNSVERDEMMTAGDEVADAAAADQERENSEDLEKRKWRDSAMSWMKRDPDSSLDSSDEERNEGVAKAGVGVTNNKRGWEKDALMSWMKRRWAKDGMGWMKRNDGEKRKWRNSNMQWVKK